ncbi:hypothetical protein PFISCL1PPCAC_16181, partial [Pristionchus fissidentatus]
VSSLLPRVSSLLLSMTTPRPSNSALVIGVSRNPNHNGQVSIGRAVAQQLARDNYDVFLVGENMNSLNSTASELIDLTPDKGQGPNPATFGCAVADMTDVTTINTAIPLICANQYNVVFFNLDFDLNQASYPAEPLNMSFKVNVLNHFLIVKAVVDNIPEDAKVFTRFVFLPSVPKGLASMLKQRMPTTDGGINALYDKTLRGESAHCYIRLAVLAMARYILSNYDVKKASARTMYPDHSSRWSRFPISRSDMVWPLSGMNLNAFWCRVAMGGGNALQAAANAGNAANAAPLPALPEPKQNPWGEKVKRFAINAEIDREHWMRGGTQAHQPFTKQELKAFGDYLEAYASRYPHP